MSTEQNNSNPKDNELKKKTEDQMTDEELRISEDDTEEEAMSDEEALEYSIKSKLLEGENLLKIGKKLTHLQLLILLSF